MNEIEEIVKVAGRIINANNGRCACIEADANAIIACALSRVPSASEAKTITQQRVVVTTEYGERLEVLAPVEVVDSAYVEHVLARAKTHGFLAFEVIRDVTPEGNIGRRHGFVRFCRCAQEARVHPHRAPSSWVAHAIRAGQDFSWLDKPTAEEKQLLVEAKRAVNESASQKAKQIAVRARACGFSHVRLSQKHLRRVVFESQGRPDHNTSLSSGWGEMWIEAALASGQDFDAIFEPRERAAAVGAIAQRRRGCGRADEGEPRLRRRL